MANQIPLSGASSAAGGILLPPEQGEILSNGLLSEAGALSLVGDARSTSKRKTTFPIWLGQPTAAMVGEAGRKPVTGAEFGSTEINVKKIASIVLFTDEQIEDVEDGDMNVLVDGGVRKAIAKTIDAHLTGWDLGATLAGGFDNYLRGSTATAVNVDTTKGDGLQKAISAAMATLEANGYGDPSEMAVLLGFGFQQKLRDARRSGTVADDNMALYGGTDPLYGLQNSVSTNLHSANKAVTAGDVQGYVVNKPNLHVRIRHDVRVAVSKEATVVMPDNTTEVNLFQDNLTAVRYETRLAFMAHDLNRAVVPLHKSA